MERVKAGNAEESSHWREEEKERTQQHIVEGGQREKEEIENLRPVSWRAKLTRPNDLRPALNVGADRSS